MSLTPCWLSAIAGLVALTAACVSVPESIKQEFRAAEPDERSNYQPAYHGTAPAADAADPWSRWGAAHPADAGALDAGWADAAAPIAVVPSGPTTVLEAPKQPAPPTTDAGAP